MYTKINSCGILGINGFMVEVEAHLAGGLPAFDIVGLPDAAVKESRERVRSAISNCGFPFPTKKITINLAPADVKKEGPIYDLPILMTLLCSCDILDYQAMEGSAFIGEVSLDGTIRPIRGCLPMTITAMEHGIKNIFLPYDNAMEASAIEGISVYGVKNIVELFAHLTGSTPLAPFKCTYQNALDVPFLGLDFAHVKGQQGAKRGATIAAAGFHNLLLIGTPGSGKSMISKRMVTILPSMTFQEMIETTKIHSVAGFTSNVNPLVTTRPFRSPHHTISPAGLSGGGAVPKPGEVSLAHNGVLFLDELPEFAKNSLEILRQPLEDSTVTISRVSGSLTYPCNFMLVCAMNPCKCGYYGHPTRECTCSPTAMSKYISKISGPLLDRLDLHIEVPPVKFDDLSAPTLDAMSSETMMKQVSAARKMQQERYKDCKILFNARITPQMLDAYCPLDEDVKILLKSAFEKLSLSARAYDKIVKVSRTIADLEESEGIKKDHVLEAIQYRSLDRKYWSF